MRDGDYVGPSRPIVGILGGMGPAATVDFLAKLVKHTPVRSEQDHLPLAVWSNAEIPDRTRALLGTGPSPVPAMVDGVTRLVTMGAETIALPCNTAHAFLDELRRRTGAPFLDMVETAVTAVLATDPGIRRVGILSTTGTRLAGLYARECDRRGIEAIELSEKNQTRLVDPAIRRVKLGEHLAEASLQIRDAAQELAQMGATAVIAGCTEIPLVAEEASSVLPWIDATDCLALAVIDHVHRSV